MSLNLTYVVPIYNTNKEYLIKCIDSLILSSANDVEVLLVDDCSTNGCEKICDEYKKKDARVKVYHLNENMGVSNARNIGIKRAVGDWIVFVDSDDWIDKDTYEKISAGSSIENDIIIFSAYKENANRSYAFGTTKESKTYWKNENQNGNEDTLIQLMGCILKQSLIGTPQEFETIKYCWGKAFKKEFLITNKIEFPNIDYCEDIVFMMSAIQKANKVIQIPERLYHYRMSATSTVNSYRPNVEIEQKEFIESLKKVINNDEDDTLYYAALLSMQICITRCFYNKQKRASLLQRHRDASKFFSQIPYSEVFKHIDILNMKKNEKWKARLIKYRLYFLYYLGSEIKKIKSMHDN